MNTLVSAFFAAPARSLRSSVRSSSAFRPASSAISAAASATGCAFAFSTTSPGWMPAFAAGPFGSTAHDHRTFHVRDVNRGQAERRPEERQAAIESADGLRRRHRGCRDRARSRQGRRCLMPAASRPAGCGSPRRHRHRRNALCIELPRQPRRQIAAHHRRDFSRRAERALVGIEGQPVGRQFLGRQRFRRLVGRRAQTASRSATRRTASRSSGEGRC